MAKKITFLVLLQLLLSFASAMLFSRMSFVGKVSISLFYKEYAIFKTVWKTALAIFIIQLALILVLTIFKKWSPKWLYIPLILLAIGIGAIGAYYTFLDFTTTSHKHMKLYFHSGGYLFWFNWLISCLFILFIRKNKPINIAETQQKTEFSIPKTSLEIIKEDKPSTSL